MNLNIVKKTETNKITNFLIYTIDTIETPYIYFHMIKDKNTIKMPSMFIKSVEDCTKFMKSNFKSFDHTYIGTISYNNENFVVYELLLIDSGISNTYYDDSWWKVLPFELIYTHKVLQFEIDPYYINFFKENPQFLYVFNDNLKYEVPVIAYLGIDYEELNTQLLTSDINYREGKYGKGYYFLTLEEAYYRSLYNDLTPIDNIIKLPNKKYISYNTIINDDAVVINENKFYLNNTFIGDVPDYCDKGEYTLYKYNTSYIYLQSKNTIKLCKYTKDLFVKKSEEGYLLRYVLFLKKHSYDKKRGYDSFFCLKNKPYYFPYYMIKDNTHSLLISYHNTKETKESINENYMFKKNKVLTIYIK